MGQGANRLVAVLCKHKSIADSCLTSLVCNMARISIIFRLFCFLVLVCVVDAPLHIRRDAGVYILPVKFIREGVDWMLSVSGEAAVLANVSFGEVDASQWVTHFGGEGSGECGGVFMGAIAVGGVKTPPWTEGCFPKSQFARSEGTPNKKILQWTVNFTDSETDLRCLLL